MQHTADLDAQALQRQRADPLAAALAEQRRQQQQQQHTLLFFGRSSCGLCKWGATHVQQVAGEHCTVVSLSTDGHSYTPEVLNYSVDAVPCFVLLNPAGEAVAKTGKPRSKAHVAASLQALLRLAQPAAQQQ